MRCWESKKDPSERLLYDPFAAILCGDENPQLPLKEEVGLTKEFWIDFIAVRSHWIDEAAGHLEQLVILGAGLDTRAYRLESLRGVPVFEIDFEEVLNAKATLLGAFEPVAKQSCIGANLTSPGWMKELFEKGFHQSSPSMWLLEGLTGYLTEEELDSLLRKVSDLAPPKSGMIATFVGVSMRENATSMHRYLVSGPQQIEELLSRFGWSCSVHGLGEVAEEYGRKEIPKDYAYYLVSATRLP